MATITPTFSKIRGPAGGIDAVVATWTGFAASADVGVAIQRPDLVDRSVAVTGTFNGGTLVVEGSNDGTNFFTLTNPAGSSLSFTAAGLMQVTEAVAYVRPRATAGSGMTLAVNMTMRRTLR
jgi:hypothetical protein